MFLRYFFVVLTLFCLPCWANEANLISNSSFSSGLKGWRSLWTRDANGGTIRLEQFGNTNFVHITHSGTKDWSFEAQKEIIVNEGDLIELSGWLKVNGKGNAALCVSSWGADGKNMGWADGAHTVRQSTGFNYVSSRFLVPAGVKKVLPRLIGYDSAEVWMTGFSLVQKEGVANHFSAHLKKSFTIDNSFLSLSLNTSNATFSVTDKRTGKAWTQLISHPSVLLSDAHLKGNQIVFDLFEVSSGLNLKATLTLEPKLPEFTFCLAGSGMVENSISYPYPFQTKRGERVIIPMNEGISYPVEDETIETFPLIAYGGHGICMAFWGITDGDAAQQTIIETPDDASALLARDNHLLNVGPLWDSQKGEFGYTRKLRYVFFDKGGYVAIAKRYRQYAKDHGFFKTLAEKRQENTNVDLLVGAVNVWNWDADPVALVKDMQSAGIERILWSRGGKSEALKELNAMGVLTSRYDIYQDVMDPTNFQFLRWTSSDWTTAAWPNDIIKKADGDWARGWGVEGKKDDWYYCGVICDKRAPEYARQRIPADLAANPYRCRFIDTTTAAPWNECYDDRHPMTRSESREYKMKLLNYISHDMKLVTGCETGHDASVPFLHYFEGMMSLGPYRVPDAGRNMDQILQDVPERVAKFQLGQRYRLPLWELVFHDCVVAQWYWGDYNNKLPSLWDKRDLFNVLYGTSPMFMFNKALWQSQKERFVKSYKNTCPWVRKVGYTEMIDHRILSPDRDVQQTVFSNGTVITVNFGNTPFTLPSGKTLAPLSYTVE